jgi:hypothetical protein
MVIAPQRTHPTWSLDDSQNNPDRAGFSGRRSRALLGRGSRAAKERPPPPEALVACVDRRRSGGKATDAGEKEHAFAACVGGEIEIDCEKVARKRRNRQATTLDEAALGLDSALRSPDY